MPVQETIKKFAEKHKIFEEESAVPETAPTIHVDEIASKVAAFYEKVRNIVDYQEEHLLRKRFIDRILRRRLMLNLDGAVAEPIIKEIIRSGHLRNDTVPETKIGEVQAIIDGYYCLVRNLRGKDGEKEELSEWLLRITANAIEENLFPPKKETMLAELMFATLRERLAVNGEGVTEREINAQLFIGVQKALLRVDADQLDYRLLKFVYPEWDAMRERDCPRVASELPSIRANINGLLHHPLAPIFFRLCDRYNTVFYLLGDVIGDSVSTADMMANLGNEERLEDDIRRAYNRRFRKERTRLNRLAFLSVLSFFISKIAIALAVEIPLETKLLHDFSLVNTLINIVFPPLLMFVIVVSIKMPSSRNSELVLEEVKSVVYEERAKPYPIDVRRKKHTLGQAIVRVFYLATFLVSFYYLVLLLLSLSFNPANIIIFTFFTSLVAATGVKLNNRSKEISLEEKKQTVLSFLVDIFALPLITLGKWIIRGLSKFNVLVIMMNFLIELPFQLFIDFVENLRSFIKSKKEEIT